MTLTHALIGVKAILGRSLSLKEVATLGDIVETNASWELVLKFFSEDAMNRGDTDTSKSIDNYLRSYRLRRSAEMRSDA